MKKSKIYLLIGLGFFVITSAIYIFALCPTIHPRDNPDILTAAITLGIPHSPGYPLFTMLGHLFSKIPLGTLPWRVNLMSAIFSAASVLVLYFIILKLSKKIWPALLGAAILAFSYYFFLQSLAADVLSLNNLFVGLELLALFSWYEKRKLKYLYLFALFFGLAFSNHQLSFILFPAFIYLFGVTDKKLFLDWKLILKLFGLFLLGLLPYLYLPIRAAQNPAYVWGAPNSFLGFLQMITRKEYTGDNFQNISFFAWRIWDWFQLMAWKEFVIVGLGLLILGIVDFWKKDKKLTFFLLFLIILSGPVFAFFSDTPSDWVEAISMERFFIFSYFILAIPIGLGANFIIERYRRLSFILILIPVGFFLLNFRQVNLRHYYYAEDLGQNMLKSLPPNTVLFAGSDVPLFELWYLQKVENLRPDVKVLPGADPKLVDLPDSTKRRLLKEFPDYSLPIEELVKKYPVYTTNDYDILWGSLTRNFIPEGIVYRFSTDLDWSKNFDGLVGLRNLKDYQYHGQYNLSQVPEKFTHEIIYYYLQGWTNLGVAYQTRKLPADAAFCYEKALQMNPDYLIAENNLAGSFLERSLYQEAVNRFKEILKKYPDLASARNGLMMAEQKLNEKPGSNQ